jgi:hypothetical protein
MASWSWRRVTPEEPLTSMEKRNVYKFYVDFFGEDASRWPEHAPFGQAYLEGALEYHHSVLLRLAALGDSED